jgi:hypothetical protein
MESRVFDLIEGLLLEHGDRGLFEVDIYAGVFIAIMWDGELVRYEKVSSDNYEIIRRELLEEYYNKLNHAKEVECL